ncbi:hypothetical protein Sgleb_72740 [Streptomyces glebosus]|uniref:Uncharacterized protein n=1 Tax=Streptomyces glebosus TaxID=249580 RepID=A0A640T677_9ACTN|nr:hypothetical protein [Streptomyces glebosus]GFE19227.1 hypothetical protein Sgleb_72740 [Streptomyces glebosus]GHG78822.1 hypothetical protein GCM10010513_55630 [Streptomyces glebosus]
MSWNVHLVWRPNPNARPAYPFDDALINRDPHDLDELQPSGGIKLSRHHVVPYNTLPGAWNTVIEREYNIKDSALTAEL